ncbi:MAG: tetratricopeptide repeat protein [Ilumatobacteraceae bacterium]
MQLGDYDAALDAIQRMVDLAGHRAARTRAYVGAARRSPRACADATRRRRRRRRTVRLRFVHLGGLWFDDGEPPLRSTPSTERSMPCRATSPPSPARRAEAALGQIETAVDHWYQVVDRAPEPGHLIEFARLLESLGRTDEAAAQWVVFDATQQLFAANGVLPDAAATLAEAERGRIDDALAASAAGIRTRPFVDMYDARAWVLHLAGRHDEAMVMIEEAMSLGGRTARFHFHAGMIALSLGDTERAVSELETALEINPWFDPISAPQARGVLDEIGAGG